MNCFLFNLFYFFLQRFHYGSENFHPGIILGISSTIVHGA